jgi:hypothetical protein
MKQRAKVVSRAGFAGTSLLVTLVAGDAHHAVAQRADSLAHDSLSRATTARLHGIVSSQNGKTPVSGADAWAISVDRHVRTDSAGEFRFDGLPAGQFVVELRHIGFEIRRDTVTLASGRETTRRFALMPTAQALDTMRSLAKESTYISPMLRGFEERRLDGHGGRFISESALRANESSVLANVIASRVPGAMLTTGRGGARRLVSRRKQCLGLAFHVCTQPNCFVEIHIDGVLIYDPEMTAKHPHDPSFDPPDLSKMGVTDLAGVEFYADAASMPIDMHSATDEGCGSLWLWTREK